MSDNEAESGLARDDSLSSDALKSSNIQDEHELKQSQDSVAAGAPLIDDLAKDGGDAPASVDIPLDDTLGSSQILKASKSAVVGNDESGNGNLEVSEARTLDDAKTVNKAAKEATTADESDIAIHARTSSSMVDLLASPSSIEAEDASQPAVTLSNKSDSIQDSTSSTHTASKPVLAQPSHRSSDTSNLPQPEDSKPTVVYGVVLVAFNHTLGPVVEYSYPENLKDDEDVTKYLPFLALPDGAHLRDEDYSCFHLYLPSIARSTVYGISCIRQLRADELVNRTADVTRSTVQKAVVVLASKPVFGPIRDKLGVITRAFFAQRDFGNTEILEHFHHSLEHALQDKDQTGEGAIYMGMSLRELVYKFRLQTLVLLKLLLLQKKVMFWGTQVERLCSFQYALVSLVPLLLLHLEDAAAPELDDRAALVTKPSSLRTSDRQSLLRYLGLPLNLFGKDAFFQPYLPLQQLEMLRAKSYLVGTTNSIFQSQRDCQIDVVVNIETANIEFLNTKLGPIVNLTAADRKWMDELIRVVETSWNPSDPHRPSDMGFKGSDDWIRSKFEEYVCSALAAIKFVDFLSKGKDAAILINTSDPTGLASFNESWLASFRSTHAFALWDSSTDPVIFDLVEPRHPCEGQAHILEDVGIRLANGLHGLHLDERLGPTQEAISKGFATGSEGVWKAYSSLRADLARRQAEYKERKEREQKEREAAGLEGESQPMPSAEPQVLANQVLSGAAEVGGKAAIFASNIGSFLGSKIAKQRSAMFSPPPLSSGDAASISKPMNELAASDIPDTKQSSSTSDTLPTRPAKTSFFSGFRSSVSPAPIATKSVDGDEDTQLSTPPLATPPGQPLSPSTSASSFTSFFRRSSNTTSLPSSLPSSQAGGALPTGAANTSKASLHNDQHILEGYEDVAGMIVDLDKKNAPRPSNITHSKKTSVDTLSDVKL